MRLLHVGLRSLLLYSLILVVISIPVSLYSVRTILEEEVDESLELHSEQFLKHIKQFEYLDDLETDLKVFDQLSNNISIRPSDGVPIKERYQTISLYDSLELEEHPFRQLTTEVEIKGISYILKFRMSLVDNDELVLAIGIVQVVLITLLAVGLLLLNRSLSKKLWKPFYRTLDQLKAYKLDKNESIQSEKTNIVEFDDLNTTVSHLTDRNRKIFLQQKEFIENASHELQTPLAIFQSKLDNLMQNPSLSESEATIIQELEETAQRMSRINKNLLLLSKIDNEQFTETEEIELAGFIKDVLANLKQVTDIDNILIESSINPLTIRANKTLIEILLTNLFHNAVRHTTLPGRVHVELSYHTLKIMNSGNALKMDPDKMFERFSKEGLIESSTGLGLAIVKKICDTCGYPLSYNFAEGLHTFRVTFIKQ